MLRIKRLYTFIYQTFLPVFAMTFGICLFIFIIQFLWQHIEKLVGKGLETSVLLELFLYAALTLVPMVLPLAILLASLMTFGNMGERLELLAIKASGVSLLKIMRPMIVLMIAISIGCFFFQDRLAPKFKVKVSSLLYAIRQTSPELDIPEGAFYNEINGYSIYVKEKNLETHMLHGVIIYDTSSGGVKNMSVDVCDSAIMIVADSKDYLTLTMFDGERFQNIKEETGRRTNQNFNSGDFVPYMRERFKKKEVIIPFKGDFVRIEESRYDDTHISKNLAQLQSSVDSMMTKLDSLNVIDRKTVASQSFVSHRKAQPYIDSVAKAVEEKIIVEHPLILDIDSVYNSYSQSQKIDILASASSEARGQSGNHLMYYHLETPKPLLQKRIRDHEITWHKMFTLPFACLVFFFIGAPLGSIIRKGGLGVPVIISVLLFIFYYIIDNIGYKMARDGVWPEWQGMWLSAAVLFPLGVFLTYKSMKESALFNSEVYGKFIRDFLKVKSTLTRSTTKEPNPAEILPLSALNADEEQIESFRALDNTTLKDIVHNYRAYNFEKEAQHVALAILKERGTYFFDVRVNNYDYNYSQRVLQYFNENSVKIAIPLYIGSLLIFVLGEIFTNLGFLSWLAILGAIAYLVFYIKSAIYMSDFYVSINKKEKKGKMFLKYLFSLFFHPIYYWTLTKEMKSDLEGIKGLRF